MKGRIKIDKEMCKGCGLCMLFCPRKLIKKGENHINSQGYYPAMFDDPENRCNSCDMCGKMCPEAAIEIIRIIEEDPIIKDFSGEESPIRKDYSNGASEEEEE